MNSHGLFANKSLLAETTELRQSLQNKIPNDRMETYAYRAWYSGLITSICLLFLAAVYAMVSSILKLSNIRPKNTEFYTNFSAHFSRIGDENEDIFRSMTFVAIVLSICFFSIKRRFSSFENKRKKNHQLESVLTTQELIQMQKSYELFDVKFSSKIAVEHAIQQLSQNENEIYERDRRRKAFLSAALESNKNAAPALNLFLQNGASKDINGIIFEHAELPLRLKK